MKCLDINLLNQRLSTIKAEYQAKKPFRHVVIENFITAEIAELIYQDYPSIKDGEWDGATYLDQKNKFMKTEFEKGSIIETCFNELNSELFLN